MENILNEKDISKESIDESFKDIVNLTKQTFDVNNDGKVDWEDAKEFLKLFLKTFVVVIFLLAMYYQNDLMEMVTSGNWDFDFLYSTFIVGGFTMLFSYLKIVWQKKYSSEVREKLSALQEAAKAKQALYERDHLEALERQKTLYEHKLDLLKKDIEYLKLQGNIIEKGIETKAKDEIARVEIVKNETQK